ncbi:hypothetical protein BV25DRAFT_293734 [Artomyces pyxidatus]|uniref:Uncharacterized protein n=1 Tax=Artomyces pyxidatus TaxID=48021 RepID=A0ACB8T622_9AGAM|nr:hypothetical protein BV25DRAFT_293734 [Artomyces pyxidatus]
MSLPKDHVLACHGQLFRCCHDTASATMKPNFLTRASPLHALRPNTRPVCYGVQSGLRPPYTVVISAASGDFHVSSRQILKQPRERAYTLVIEPRALRTVRMVIDPAFDRRTSDGTVVSPAERTSGLSSYCETSSALLIRPTLSEKWNLGGKATLIDLLQQ